MASELPALTVADAATWRAWLGDHHNESGGVWLVLAKKGRTDPTRLTYEEALQEALAHGWIDGQVRRGDEHSYRQRFTPRRARSVWSKRNVEIVERLLAEGRMHPSGVLQMQRAKEDGRWAPTPVRQTSRCRAQPRAVSGGPSTGSAFRGAG